jgi:hypothetical protein
LKLWRSTPNPMKLHPITHEGGKPDLRYSIAQEFCGHAEKRFVARFCGEWIGQSISYPGAVLLAVGHNCQRKGAGKSKARIGLESLNANYGRGSVGEIRVCLDGSGSFEQKPFNLRSSWRRFRVHSVGRSVRVFALGHQITIR